MIKIGITGSIGMGKTTISKMLSCINVPVFDSDSVVGKILNSNGSVISKLNTIWPGVLIKKKNTIDKKKLRKIVFSNEKDRKKLEKILHPLVEKDKLKFIKKHEKRKILAFDVPLLYETGQQKKYDYIFLAVCKISTQMSRVLRRKGMTNEIFKKINKSQMNTEEKIKMKPIVINTDRLKIFTFFDVMINILYIKKKGY